MSKKKTKLKDLVGVCKYHAIADKHTRHITVHWLHAELPCCEKWVSVRESNEV